MPCFTTLRGQRPEKQFTCLDRLFHWCICSRNDCDLWLQQHWLTTWTFLFHQCYSALLRVTAGSIQQLHMTPWDRQKQPSLPTMLYNIFDRMLNKNKTKLYQVNCKKTSTVIAFNSTCNSELYALHDNMWTNLSLNGLKFGGSGQVRSGRVTENRPMDISSHQKTTGAIRQGNANRWQKFIGILQCESRGVATGSARCRCIPGATRISSKFAQFAALIRSCYYTQLSSESTTVCHF